VGRRLTDETSCNGTEWPCYGASDASSDRSTDHFTADCSRPSDLSETNAFLVVTYVLQRPKLVRWHLQKRRAAAERAAVVPTALHPTRAAADLFLDRHRTTMMCDCGSRNTPRTVGAGRNPRYAHASHRHRVTKSLLKGAYNKEGGPDITVTVTSVSLFEFLQEQGGSVFIGTGMPGTPQPTFTKHEKSFTDRPGMTLAEACQPLFDLLTRMVDEFERAHPPPN
jgi:hypothetical protein